MRLIAYAVDAAPGHLVEAGFDHFRVEPDSVNAIDVVESNITTKFYPNPLVNNKTVYFNSSKGNINTITITDLTGRIVDTFNLNASQGSINLSQTQASGTYMLNVYQNGVKMSTEKLVILEE